MKNTMIYSVTGQVVYNPHFTITHVFFIQPLSVAGEGVAIKISPYLAGIWAGLLHFGSQMKPMVAALPKNSALFPSFTHALLFLPKVWPLRPRKDRS